MSKQNQKTEDKAPTARDKKDDAAEKTEDLPKEHGGRGGLDPARYGDWEIGGKCVDF